MNNYDDSGPLRHPRPLTPAEMYLELEQEQEAVVSDIQSDMIGKPLT